MWLSGLSSRILQRSGRLPEISSVAMTMRPSAEADGPGKFPGGLLFLVIGPRRSGGGETGPFGPLDLGHAAVVDDKLDHAVAEARDFLAHECDPVGIIRSFGRKEMGRSHERIGWVKAKTQMV